MGGSSPLPVGEVIRKSYLEANTVSNRRGKSDEQLAEANVSPRGLVFDFDGLILDTEGPEYQSWLEIYGEHTCELPLSVWSACIGTAMDVFNPYDYLESQYGKPIDREAVRAKHKTRCAELLEGQLVLPGVREYVLDAKRLGIKLGVASSSSRWWVAGHLERLGLIEHFDCIRTRDDVTHSKPDPELFLSAAECLGLRPEEAIAIEDSPNGVTAAKRAGLFCVAVPNLVTRELPLEHADLVLTSLAELPLEQLILLVQDRRNGSR
jgi:HAD superfamily hydrolase (TIGR01509 family)